jgi:hypothetical protein
MRSIHRSYYIPLLPAATLALGVMQRLELLTAKGVEMLLRNIRRGRRDAAELREVWAARIDAELARRKAYLEQGERVGSGGGGGGRDDEEVAEAVERFMGKGTGKGKGEGGKGKGTGFGLGGSSTSEEGEEEGERPTLAPLLAPEVARFVSVGSDVGAGYNAASRLMDAMFGNDRSATGAPPPHSDSPLALAVIFVLGG